MSEDCDVCFNSNLSIDSVYAYPSGVLVVLVSDVI
jgi:hypothetical protein